MNTAKILMDATFRAMERNPFRDAAEALANADDKREPRNRDIYCPHEGKPVFWSECAECVEGFLRERFGR